MHEKILAADVNAGAPSPPLTAVLPAPGEDCGTYLNASIRPNRDRSLVRMADALTVGWMQPLLVREPAHETGSLGSSRATDARPRGKNERAAANRWETDGGSGT